MQYKFLMVEGNSILFICACVSLSVEEGIDGGGRL